MAMGTYLQMLLNVWNIRCMLLLSFSVQIVLAIAAPFRMTSRTWAPVIVWSTYLLSDSVSIYTTGQISNTIRTSSTSTTPLQVNLDILALWMSILLIHTGGPDTITAYSLEDSSLWLRHVVRFVGQLAVISYIFLKTFPGNNLLVPTLLVLMAGVIKYSDRTRALFLASLENLKDSIGKRLIKERPSEDISVSYYFYERFRGMIIDVMPSPSELRESRNFFKDIRAERALEVVSGELNMMYDELYTRITALHSNLGYLIGPIYVSCVIAALVLFRHSSKKLFDGVDVNITYCLLAGLLFIQFGRGFMPYFSATSRVLEIKKGFFSLLISIGPKIMSLCITCKPWSRKMGAFNLLDCTIRKHCLTRNKRKNKAIRCCGGVLDKAINWFSLNDRLDKMIRTSTKCFLDEFWEFIFGDLQQKALEINNEEQARKAYESKGESALNGMNLRELEKSYMQDFDYGKALLCWHIATEICYNVHADENNNRKWSKILSDYLMYLLIHQPKLMSAVVGISHKRYIRTCLEVTELANKLEPENLKDFCAKALEERANHDAETGRRELHEKSVLSDACNLATFLKNSNNKWEIIVKVWAEMLSYAAGHCRGNEHARTVSQGGELLTHVWLLMAHFGITAQWPKD